MGVIGAATTAKSDAITVFIMKNRKVAVGKRRRAIAPIPAPMMPAAGRKGNHKVLGDADESQNANNPPSTAIDEARAAGEGLSHRSTFQNERLDDE